MHALDHAPREFDHPLPHPFCVAERGRFFIPPEALWELDQHLCHREQRTECFGRSLLEPTAFSHLSIDEHNPLDGSRFTSYGSSTHVEHSLALVRCRHQYIAGLRASKNLTCEQ